MRNDNDSKIPYGLSLIVLTLCIMGPSLTGCGLVSVGHAVDGDSLATAKALTAKVSQSSIEEYSGHFNSPRCMYGSADEARQAKEYILQELKKDGYASITEDDVTIPGMTIADGKGTSSGVSVRGPFTMPNIIVTKKGSSPELQPVLIGAHYDTVANGPGANDNGSGCAALLELARVLAGTDYPRTIIMVFFAFEEPGLLGSQQYVSKLSPSEYPIVSYILDTIGITTKDEKSLPLVSLPKSGDFIAAMSSSSDEAKDAVADFLTVTNGLSVNLPAYGLNADAGATSSLLTSNLMRSDHLPFLVKGLPAMLITDTANFRDGIEYYHMTTDTTGNIDYPFLTKVTSAVLACVAVNARR
jgi:Zn-dependent M28 family amino/carboxypeptidase